MGVEAGQAETPAADHENDRPHKGLPTPAGLCLGVRIQTGSIQAPDVGESSRGSLYIHRQDRSKGQTSELKYEFKY